MIMTLASNTDNFPLVLKKGLRTQSIAFKPLKKWTHNKYICCEANFNVDLTKWNWKNCQAVRRQSYDDQNDLLSAFEECF